jgi:DNA-binding MarR family transcriptional regulator
MPTSARDTSLDQIWSKLQPLFIAKRNQVFAVMNEHGLTPPHMQALTMLVDGPVRMRDIADLMVCDASYVTAIVDNLEHLGLATRQPSSVDRRVKEIALTPLGERTAAHIGAQMSAPPPGLEQLSHTDRAALARILGTLDLDETQALWPHIGRRAPNR